MTPVNSRETDAGLPVDMSAMSIRMAVPTQSAMVNSVSIGGEPTGLLLVQRLPGVDPDISQYSSGPVRTANRDYGGPDSGLVVDSGRADVGIAHPITWYDEQYRSPGGEHQHSQHEQEAGGDYTLFACDFPAIRGIAATPDSVGRLTQQVSSGNTGSGSRLRR